MRKKTKIIGLFLSILLVSSITGCNIYETFGWTETNRNYYETHTGTEDVNTTFPKWKYADNEEETEKVSDKEAGQIEGCGLRTGVETDAYADSSASEKKVTLPANMDFVISSMDGNYFEVSYDGSKVWVPSKNCLINAKDFIPAMEVDLGLAHSPNFFNIGGTNIKGLTEKQLYSREGCVNGTELWLRYEVAVKLLKAQEMFLKDGYIIKIVDGYRPESLTGTIKDAYNEFIKTDEGVALKKEYLKGYDVGSFVNEPGVCHSCGIAVDITLLDKDSKKELEMPSAMHELDYNATYDSWRSKSGSETSHGEYMRGIMKDCGFDDNDLEWWHFQVNSLDRIKFDIPN